MSYPRKRRGRRTLILGECRYQWKLWPSSPNSRLVITGIDNGGQRLEATLFDWQDPWLTISELQVEEGSLTLFSNTENAQAVIASGFVRELIEFGLGHGWKPEAHTSPLYLEYKDGIPAVSAAPSRSLKEFTSPANPAGMAEERDSGACVPSDRRERISPIGQGNRDVPRPEPSIFQLDGTRRGTIPIPAPSTTDVRFPEGSSIWGRPR